MIGGPIINLDTFARSASRTFLLQQSYFLLENVYYFFFFSKSSGGEGAAPPSPSLCAGPEFARPKKRSNPVSVIGVCIQWYIWIHTEKG